MKETHEEALEPWNKSFINSVIVIALYILLAESQKIMKDKSLHYVDFYISILFLYATQGYYIY